MAVLRHLIGRKHLAGVLVDEDRHGSTGKDYMGKQNDTGSIREQVSHKDMVKYNPVRKLTVRW